MDLHSKFHRTRRQAFGLGLLAVAGLPGCTTLSTAGNRVVSTARSVVGLGNAPVVAEYVDFVLVRLAANVTTPGSAAGLAAADSRSGDLLYLTDQRKLRMLESNRQSWTDLSVESKDASASVLENPTGVAVNSRHILVTSEARGTALRIDRATGEILLEAKGLDRPRGILELSDGSLIVVEAGSRDRATGKVSMISGPTGERRSELATSLATPTGIVASIGGLFITESDTGAILRLDPVTRNRSVLTDGLEQPQGIAVTTTGRLAVIEAGAARLSIVNPSDGRANVRAGKLPLGVQANSAVGWVGLAAGDKESLYFVSNQDGALYQLRRRS